MSLVSNICIADKSGDNIKIVSSVEVIANKGIVNDRYFSDQSKKDTQITLIESENIDFFNNLSNTNFLPTDFRRNIITKGIKLNNLVGNDILIGTVRVKAHRLCDPCKYLQDLLNQKNLVKNLLNKGGLRCEIKTNGTISINDLIKVL